jgi:hypothetical protein
MLVRGVRAGHPRIHATAWEDGQVRRLESAVNSVAGRLGLQVSRIGSAAAQLPVEASSDDAAQIAALRPFTMTSATRLWSLVRAVRYLESEGIGGDFVECGVWRGGSVMAMAGELARLGASERKIWLYDTFSGMTDPSSRDIEAVSGTPAQQLMETTPVGDGNNVWCVAGLDDVRANVATTGYPMDQFVFVEGDVAVTLQTHAPERVALLRLDTDWYESTKVSLTQLFPKLAVGGVCIFDDYGHWQGARDAVDEYFTERNYQPLLLPIDFSGRILIKSREIPH